jgi:hypothetical protein
MPRNNKRTSSKIASEASRTLRNPRASARAKSLAGSALSQRDPKKQTGKAMEGKAAKAVFGRGASASMRRTGGSVLSQSNKSR